MAIDKKKIMDKATNASTGLAVAVAFLNAALLVTRIVKTVSETTPKLDKTEK